MTEQINLIPESVISEEITIDEQMDLEEGAPDSTDELNLVITDELSPEIAKIVEIYDNPPEDLGDLILETTQPDAELQSDPALESYLDSISAVALDDVVIV